MEMRGEVVKKTPKKEMDNPSFLWHNFAAVWSLSLWEATAIRHPILLLYEDNHKIKLTVTSCSKNLVILKRTENIRTTVIKIFPLSLAT